MNQLNLLAFSAITLLFMPQLSFSEKIREEVVVTGTREKSDPNVFTSEEIDYINAQNRLIANSAQAAAERRRGEHLQALAKERQRALALCVQTAVARASGCESSAGSAHSRDTRACGGITSAFNGQLEVSVGVISLSSSLSPDALHQQCTGQIDAIRDARMLNCVATRDAQELACAELYSD